MALKTTWHAFAPLLLAAKRSLKAQDGLIRQDCSVLWSKLGSSYVHGGMEQVAPAFLKYTDGALSDICGFFLCLGEFLGICITFTQGVLSDAHELFWLPSKPAH